MMRVTVASLAVLLFLVVGCSHTVDLAQASSQENYGVQAARMNLWREALFRFQRAVQISPDDPMAHNNLAVAWEANGDFEKARKEYLEALKLDKSNQYIQKNYSRFVEFLSRNKKRQGQKPAVGNTPPAGMQNTVTTGGSTSGPGPTPTPLPGPKRPEPAPGPTPEPPKPNPPGGGR